MSKKILSLAAATAMLCGGLALPAYADDPHNRIKGGTEAAEGAYPWMANFNGGCGGSLVSKDIILTAQHCVAMGRAGRMEFAIGKVNWKQGIKRTGTASRQGAGIEKSDDWAVVKLNQPVEGTAFLDVPTDDRFDTQPTMRTIGWGMMQEGGGLAPTLREVDLPFVPDDKCGRTANPKGEICAGNSKATACKGDSGGPLMGKDGNKWVLLGMTSWGQHDCARDNAPGHWAQLSYFIPKVKKAITDLGGTMPANWSDTPPPAPPAPAPPAQPAPAPAPPQSPGVPGWPPAPGARR